MKSKIILFGLILLTLSNDSIGQSKSENEYKSALGAKYRPLGVTYKNFIGNNKAIEGVAYFLEQGARVTLLYEVHNSINGIDGLKWYAGPGLHMSLYNNYVIGLDGVLGLDYRIPSTSIGLSLDWQPSFDFGKGSNFNGDWGGLSIRYIFN